MAVEQLWYDVLQILDHSRQQWQLVPLMLEMKMLSSLQIQEVSVYAFKCLLHKFYDKMFLMCS